MNYDTIDKVCDYLFSKNLKQTDANTFDIVIFHLHIGSKTSTLVHCLPDTTTTLNTSTTLDILYNHNHEYTQLLQTLFNNPIEQFSPVLIDSLSHFSGKDIHIHNIVILFDPQYKIAPDLEGFKIEHPFNKPISIKDINYNETIVHHLNDTFTLIKSSLEIIQVSCNVNQTDIKIIIDIINYLSDSVKIPNLINIIDCSSKTLIELYALVSNTESNIHIIRPDCAHKDKAQISNPMITIDNKKRDPLDQINSIRWLNYKDDSKLITDLKEIKDVCKVSEKSFDFLIELYKYTIGIENLKCIMKLWARLSYTNLQHIYEDETQGKPVLSIKFNNITLIEFINYWNELKAFREFIFNNSCSDYQYHIMIYINDFVNNYKTKTDVFTLTEALQFEAFEIFRTLMNYYCEDACYIIKNIKNIKDKEGYKLLERKHIIDYLTFNKIHF